MNIRLAVFAGLLLSAVPAQAEQHQRQFPMREVSAIKESGDWYRLLRGQMITCEKTPDQTAKYPAMRSSRALYGALAAGVALNEADKPPKFLFAVDESALDGDAPHYDLLYLDQNNNLDLNDDPVLHINPEPPQRRGRPGKQSRSQPSSTWTCPSTLGPRRASFPSASCHGWSLAMGQTQRCTSSLPSLARGRCRSAPGSTMRCSPSRT